MTLFGKSSVVGVEIDSSEIRAVELKIQSGKPQLIAWGRIGLPKGAVSEGGIVDVDIVKEALISLKRDNGIGQAHALLGVLNQSVLVRVANFPNVEKSKRDNMIRIQAQDFLPLPLMSVNLDYEVLSGEDKEQIEVLLVAAKQDMIRAFVSALNAARWKIQDIDVTVLVLNRVLPIEQIGKTVAVVNIADGMTGLLIAAEGMPRLVRILGNRFEDVAAIKGYGLEEVIEKTTSNDEEISKWLEKLTSEIRSSINYYHGQQSDFKVSSVFLSGRGARLKGLQEYLSLGLGLPVDLIDPLFNAGIEVHRDDEIIHEAADFSVSIGLALRGLEG